MSRDRAVGLTGVQRPRFQGAGKRRRTTGIEGAHESWLCMTLECVTMHLGAYHKDVKLLQRPPVFPERRMPFVETSRSPLSIQNEAWHAHLFSQCATDVRPCTVLDTCHAPERVCLPMTDQLAELPLNGLARAHVCTAVGRVGSQRWPYPCPACT